MVLVIEANYGKDKNLFRRLGKVLSCGASIGTISKRAKEVAKLEEDGV